MAKPIRSANSNQRECLDAAAQYLRQARTWLRAADTPKALAKLESTIRSVDGAKRHMQRRLNRKEA